MLALGKSEDWRALEPLLGLLKRKDYRTAGFAAQALGYLGDPEAEANLVELLSHERGWVQVKACGALAKMGTRRAVAALERLAKDDRYTGALNIRRMARYAIESIEKREKR
jgi:HEAT repeat protein